MKWMAFHYAFCATPEASQSAVLLHGLDEILTARGMESAMWPQHGTDIALVASCQQDQHTSRQSPEVSQHFRCVAFELRRAARGANDLNEVATCCAMGTNEGELAACLGSTT